MNFRVKTNTVILDIYVAIAKAITQDEDIKALLDGVVIDFDFIDKEEEFNGGEGFGDPIDVEPPHITPFRLPTHPKNPPRITLLPQTAEYPRFSSCNNKLTLHFNVVLEGFHVRSARFYRLVFRLVHLLRNLPLTCLTEGNEEFPVICDVGSGSWNYDDDGQFMSYSMGIEVNAYI